MRSIAIIPARSGSKGLPDKNIMNLNGKPLMFYTISTAIKSCRFEEIMVSTDSEHYADIAKECGAAVPFLRSAKMSSDTAGTWDAVREVLCNYYAIGKEYDYIALLQPTTPLRGVDDIEGVFTMLERPEVNSVVTVTEVPHPVQWCFKMSESGSMKEMADSPYSYMRRQELEKHYLENGAIYLVDAKKIMDVNYNFYADNCYGYIMPREKSVDIDTKIDMLVASAYLKLKEIR